MASTKMFACVLLVVLVACADAKGSSKWKPSFEDEYRINKVVSSCYTYAIDFIGNLGPLDEAEKLMAPCFTKDVLLTVVLPGTNVTAVGVKAIVQTVKATYVPFKYIQTQHLVGNQRIFVLGKNKVRQISYVIAAQVNPDRSLNYFNGYYEDTIVKQGGVWKVKELILWEQNFITVKGAPVTGPPKP